MAWMGSLSQMVMVGVLIFGAVWHRTESIQGDAPNWSDAKLGFVQFMRLSIAC